MVPHRFQIPASAAAAALLAASLLAAPAQGIVGRRLADEAECPRMAAVASGSDEIQVTDIDVHPDHDDVAVL
jgi:hypothetical protein